MPAELPGATKETIEAMQKVIDRLTKTKDRVPVVYNVDYVWRMIRGKPMQSNGWDSGGNWATFGGEESEQVWDCYSTKEAVIAAYHPRCATPQPCGVCPKCKGGNKK